MEVLWRCLERRGVPVAYIQVSKDIYNGLRTRVRTLLGNTDDFPIDIRLHQGSALGPPLFTIVMDEITRGIQDEVPWCILFANDIYLIDETKEVVNNKLEQWRATLEAKGFRLSRLKTECLHYCFSAGEDGIVDKITMKGVVISRVKRFKYLESIIQGNEEID